jgi:hypothetical protein
MNSHGQICAAKHLYEEHERTLRIVEEMKQEILNQNERIMEIQIAKDSLEKQKTEQHLCIAKLQEDIEMAKHQGNLEMARLKGESDVYSNLLGKKEDFLMEMAKQPKIVNNMKTNNNGQNSSSNSNINATLAQMGQLDLFSVHAQEKFKKITEEKYTLEYFNNGQKGKAKFTMDHLLIDADGKALTICGDLNRQHLYYKDMNGDIVSDIKAEKINHATHPHIRAATSEIFKKEYNKELNNGRTDEAIAIMEIFTSINDDSDTTIYRSELSELSYTLNKYSVST